MTTINYKTIVACNNVIDLLNMWVAHHRQPLAYRVPADNLRSIANMLGDAASAHSPGEGSAAARVVKLDVGGDGLAAIAAVAGNAELYKAIGYLSQWGMDYGFCQISGGADGNDVALCATYRHHDGQPLLFVLMAVWTAGVGVDSDTGLPNAGHFSFHS